MDPSFDIQNAEKQLRWFKSPDNQMTWMFIIPKLVSQILYIKHLRLKVPIVGCCISGLIFQQVIVGVFKKNSQKPDILGAGFKYFLFSPLPGEDSHFD